MAGFIPAIRRVIADADVRLNQRQLRSGLPVMAQIVQQPDQRQLCIWLRIDP
jgi:hypothetical protein